MVAAIFALLSLGVVAIIIKDFTEKGSQGPAVLGAVGTDITGFYGSLSGTSQGK